MRKAFRLPEEIDAAGHPRAFGKYFDGNSIVDKSYGTKLGQLSGRQRDL
jgi:hypothetical protein